LCNSSVEAEQRASHDKLPSFFLDQAGAERLEFVRVGEAGLVKAVGVKPFPAPVPFIPPSSVGGSAPTEDKPSQQGPDGNQVDRRSFVVGADTPAHFITAYPNQIESSRVSLSLLMPKSTVVDSASHTIQPAPFVKKMP
jgi:hypothetical protein